MRWRWLGVAVLAACSGNDEVMPDGTRGADADGASVDGMPDASPMLAMGPVHQFDERVPGAAIGNATTDVAWNGSEFVLTSGFTVTRIGLDGVQIDVRVSQTIPVDAIACHDSGVCILVDTFVYSNVTRFVRIAADGTPIDTAPIELAMSSDLAPEVGATEDGFIIATVSFLGVDAVRVGLSGPPLDSTPIELMADTSAAASPERSAMACDDLGCTIAVRDSLEIDDGPVRLVRLWTDGTHGPPVDVADAYAVAGFACAAGICLLTQQRDGLAGPVEGMLLDAAGTHSAIALPVAAESGGTSRNHPEHKLASAQQGLVL